MGTGLDDASPTYHLTRLVLLRGVAVVCLLAFLSLWVQIDGLIGSNGVLPFTEYLSLLERRLDAEAVRSAPTVLWWWASDGGLHALCGVGVVASLCLLAGLLEGPSVAVLLVAYVSLSTVGQRFLGYQWDTLLVETLFVCLFLARWRTVRGTGTGPTRPAIWAVRLLLCKLMFLSGWVKLSSGDAVWWDLSALTYHYWTQPLPNPVSWYVHHLPLWLHQVSCLAMFVCELGFPFLVLAPWRQTRLAAAGGTVMVMMGLLVTGNYGFFQLLTLVLAVSLLDDGDLRPLVPSRWVPERGVRPSPLLSWVVGVLLVPYVLLSGVRADMRMFDRTLTAYPVAVQSAVRATYPLRVVNSYGLFANMTETRPELFLEGSNDGGQTWVRYGFRAKPGDRSARPVQVAPHMPRLDWQLWFAALGSCERNRWVETLMDRVLAEEPSVMALLGDNPFPQGPPERVRMVRVELGFTWPGQSGWWVEKGRAHPYCRVRKRSQIQTR